MPRSTPWLVRTVLVFALLASTSAARGDTLHAAVAANFLAAFRELALTFRKRTGHDLIPSVGSSGQLHAQIRQGAPFDIFLSADRERPRALEQSGETVPGTRFTYAIGTLVLWSPSLGRPWAGGRLNVLREAGHVAIADPETAPYGAAARRVLRTLGLWTPLTRAKRVVTGTSIAQAHQLAAAGQVACAFVALAQVVGADGKIPGSFWIVPEAQAGDLSQDAVVLRRSSHQAAAREFLAWLRTDPAARAILHRTGYRAGES